MDLYDAINTRFSVRSYLPKPIEEEKLTRLLLAAQAAPTGRNRQEWTLIVVRDAALRKALAAAASQPFIGGAPVILALVGMTPENRMFCTVAGDPVDGAIVLDHVSLAAVAEGLGCCWIGHFDQSACREILDVPATATIIELMPVGYPAVSAPATKKRKPLSALIRYDRYPLTGVGGDRH